MHFKTAIRGNRPGQIRRSINESFRVNDGPLETSPPRHNLNWWLMQQDTVTSEDSGQAPRWKEPTVKAP